MRRALSLCLCLCLLFSCGSVLCAARIPVYRVDGELLYFDRASGAVTGFAGAPTYLSLPSQIGGYAVTKIAARAFAGCTSLRSIDLPDSLVSIEANAFAGCTSLNRASIGSGVASIGEDAFGGCRSLADISFRGAVATIAYSAFSDTAWANSSVQEYVIAGQTYLYRYNGAALHAVIPGGVTKIADRAFAYNALLQSVTLPEGLREIGDNAFLYCTALTSVQAPSTLSSIGIGAFDGTPWLRYAPTEFVELNHILIAYQGTDDCVTVPADVVGIGRGAFLGNQTVRAVYLPYQCYSIDEAAFSNCASLEFVAISWPMAWIEESAFDQSPRAVICAEPGTYAMQFAAAQGIASVTPVCVYWNDARIYYDLICPVLGGIVYVPLRLTAEVAGATVGWNGTEAEVEIGGTIYAVDAEKNQVSRDGRAIVLSAPLVTLDERTMIAARDLANWLDADLWWMEEYRSLYFATK